MTLQTYLLIRTSSAIPVLEFSGMCSILRTVSKNVTFTLLRTVWRERTDKKWLPSHNEVREHNLIPSLHTVYLFLLFLQTSLILRRAENSLRGHLWASGWGTLWPAACCLSWNWTSTWAQCQMLKEQPTGDKHQPSVTLRNLVWTKFLPALGLGLNPISNPLTTRAQFSCTRAAHGTVREIVWINPVMTSNGASAVSSSSFSDWETK